MRIKQKYNPIAYMTKDFLPLSLEAKEKQGEPLFIFIWFMYLTGDPADTWRSHSTFLILK